MSAMYCTKCGREVYESSVTIGTEDTLGDVNVVVGPGVPLNKPCGHRAPIRRTGETVSYPRHIECSPDQHSRTVAPAIPEQERP